MRQSQQPTDIQIAFVNVTKSLVATAYHEAGHAVAYIHIGLPLYLVTIKRKGNSLGRVEPGFETVKGVRLPDNQCRDLMTSVIAGFRAEFRHSRWAHCSPTPWHERNPASWYGDFTRAVEYARNCTAGDRQKEDRLLKECWDAANNLLFTNWVDVERLASALLRYKEMSGQEARAALRVRCSVKTG
jgi:hypothetical protein